MIPRAPEVKENPNSPYADPEWIRQKQAEVDAQYGAPPAIEPGLTAEILQERIGAKLRARGIDPDSIRYEQKYEGE